MIVFKNEQGIYYAFFSNNFDLESLKSWLIFYRKYDGTIKAYREDDGGFIELELLEEQTEPENNEKSSKKK